MHNQTQKHLGTAGKNVIPSDPLRLTEIRGLILILFAVVFCWLVPVPSALGAPPTILEQPSSQTVNPDAMVTFGVTTSGTLPFNYVWYFNGETIKGAIGPSLTISSVQEANAGSYFVVVGNSEGSIISASAVLTVNKVAPTIVIQPTNQYLYNDTNAIFSVTAKGTQPLSYQWQKDANIISGATNSTFTIRVKTRDDLGFYSVKVINAYGSVTSQMVTLNINAPIILSAPEQVQYITEGLTAIFSVNAVGCLIHYQWRKNGINIPGATGPSLSIKATKPEDAAYYEVWISNPTSTTKTLEVWLYVNIPPSITTQPESQASYPGTTNTFSVNADGTEPLSYQWMKDGVNIESATNSQYVISNAQIGDFGNYTVIVTNVAGHITSSPAVLYEHSVPLIVSQPQKQTINSGNNTTLSVTALGTPPIQYIWQRQQSGSTNWIEVIDNAVFSGSQTPALSISEASYDLDGDKYQCQVKDGKGSVVSEMALLRVYDSTAGYWTFTTFAGKAGQYGSNDGLGTNAMFSGFGGIAADKDGNLFVADNFTIRKVTQAGLVSTFAGLAGQPGNTDGHGTNARFEGSSSLCIDIDGNIYVSDNGQSLRKVTPSGDVVTIRQLTQFNSPSSMTVRNGVTYIGDSPNPLGGKNGKIVQIDQLGVYKTLASGFSSLFGMAFDSVGNLYVSAFNRQYERYGYDSGLFKINPKGVVTTISGTNGPPGSSDGKGATFYCPFGIAMDTNDVLYVADSHNFTIRTITQNGNVSTIGGKAGQSGIADGIGADARFSLPMSVAIDGAGNLYVTDVSSTIRKGVYTKAPEVGVKLGIRASPMRITMATDTIHSYQLQTCSNLTTPDWINNGALMKGNGSEISVTNVASGINQRFYRVVSVP